MLRRRAALGTVGERLREGGLVYGSGDDQARPGNSSRCTRPGASVTSVPAISPESVIFDDRSVAARFAASGERGALAGARENGGQRPSRGCGEIGHRANTARRPGHPAARHRARRAAPAPIRSPWPTVRTMRRAPDPAARITVTTPPLSTSSWNLARAPSGVRSRVAEAAWWGWRPGTGPRRLSWSPANPARGSGRSANSSRPISRPALLNGQLGTRRAPGAAAGRACNMSSNNHG